MGNRFKIYGCERTCTNYWRKLLSDNFQEYKSTPHPWVHGEPELVSGLTDKVLGGMLFVQ